MLIYRTSSDCCSPEELKLLASCIKLHSVLFCIIPEDIIKCFEIYNFLPGYPVRMKRKDIQIHDTYYTQSRIYAIVCCKEAKVGEYPVLFSYLNFFHNVVGITIFYFPSFFLCQHIEYIIILSSGSKYARKLVHSGWIKIYISCLQQCE